MIRVRVIKNQYHQMQIFESANVVVPRIGDMISYDAILFTVTRVVIEYGVDDCKQEVRVYVE